MKYDSNMHCHMILLIFYPEVAWIKPDTCEGSAWIHDLLKSLIQYHQFHQGSNGIQAPIPKFTEGSNGIQNLLLNFNMGSDTAFSREIFWDHRSDFGIHRHVYIPVAKLQYHQLNRRLLRVMCLSFFVSRLQIRFAMHHIIYSIDFPVSLRHQLIHNDFNDIDLGLG